MIWHFKGHPYGRDPLEGLETIPQITRDDLVTFFRKYFIAPNIIACVSGDIEEQRMLQSLGKLFSSLRNGQGHERLIEDPQRTPPILALVHKPGQYQSQVVMILPSVKRTHPDYWKLSLLLHLLGGSESLLYTRLRDDLGLVYAAWFQQTYRWKAGMLIGYIGCKADKTAEAIAETANIMTALGRSVPGDELERKRLDLLNSFVFNVDTPSELVGVYGRYHMRKEPLDTLERIQDAYMRSRGKELEALARHFLDPKGMQVFVVADKTTTVKRDDGVVRSLEEELKGLSQQLGLPYTELPLR